ncbi:hypothetical protein [Humidisolicoccus flavus]|uniref:hypothetical protein n=1 Tax=Humidisolicoccus flavus TaxID=3111414 RepID=UPI00324CE567
MTNPGDQSATDQRSTEIRLPAVAILLLGVGIAALFIGSFLLLGTRSQSFSPELLQTRIASLLLLVGGVSLLAALILDGVRGIAQRQLDILLRAQSTQGSSADPTEETRP